MTGVVIVDGARTPHGTLLGSLSEVEAVELARTALDGLVDRGLVGMSIGGGGAIMALLAAPDLDRAGGLFGDRVRGRTADHRTCVLIFHRSPL